MYSEPDVIVNNVQLTGGEAMTLRVAVSCFLSDMVVNGLGDDEAGKVIAEGYIKNSESILNKMGVM